MFDHNIFQDNLVGSTFASRWSKRQPERVGQGATTAAPHSNLHGYRNISDIMTR